MVDRKNKLVEYFKGDELAADAIEAKYLLKDELPDDMHLRMAKEFARIQTNYVLDYRKFLDTEDIFQLSNYGQDTLHLNEEEKGFETKEELLKYYTDKYYSYFKNFRFIVPAGSIMSMLGNNTQIGSLSNCFVNGQPNDSYGSIMLKREEQIQLMKRRGGVGKDLSLLRPRGAEVNNAAKSSTGAASFMDVDSALTNEVAQGGRRGALMLTMSIKHPDSLEFINKKQDLTKVTGANVSLKISNDFIEAVKKNTDYILRYPIDSSFDLSEKEKFEYNKLYSFDENNKNPIHIKRIKAREYWDALVQANWNSAEPGIIYEDNHHDYSPDGVYDRYRGVTTNPCFHPDTLIDTIHGKIKISEITKPTYVYSMDKFGKLCIVKSSAAFKTKLNTNTLKITLRCGSSIMVTPDHKMYVQNVGWVEAKDLKLNMRIAHILRGRRGKKYIGVKLTTESNRSYQSEHRLIYQSVYGKTNDDIHHIDGNTFNNDILNLESINHSKHSSFTALNQNPQTHQERDETGKFISYSENKVIKGVLNLPDNLATKFKSSWDNVIISIEEGENTDVYDIQVPNTNCLIANNMVAHNCGEIFMQPYDSCRLIHLNLTSFVTREFTKFAKFNLNKFYEMCYEASVLGDNLVDLEIEHINRILEHIKDEKSIEYQLWIKIRKEAMAGRRVGVGFTGLFDVLAMIGFDINQKETLDFIDEMMKIKMKAELAAQIDMAILRGEFEGYSHVKEYNTINNIKKGNNRWYQFILDTFPEEMNRMFIYGRRNISFSTVAPTGTVSLMTQTTSGLEPLFLPYYMRRKKVMNPNDRVDFIDEVGERFTEYPVIHPMFKEWIINNYPDEVIENITKEKMNDYFKKSPWFGQTANDLDYKIRLQIQSIIQKYTTHSISSTLNLPKDVPVKTISDIYMLANDIHLKGVTVYRDTCRNGILYTEEPKNDGEFISHSAIKRPKSLTGELYTLKNRKDYYIVVIGLYDGKPYETFVFKTEPKDEKEFLKYNKTPLQGEIIKIKQGVYKFVSEEITIPNLNDTGNNELEKACALYTSMLLRTGARIEYVIKTAQKIGTINSFTNVLNRVLSNYIPKDVELKCSSCGGRIIMENGCEKCIDCGSSKCNFIRFNSVLYYE